MTLAVAESTLPMEAERLSTTKIFPYSSAAIMALWQVPESSAEMVMTTALSPARRTRSNISAKASGVA